MVDYLLDGIGACGVGPDYFKAIGTPLVRGREILQQDAAYPRTVAIINEAAARAYFPVKTHSVSKLPEVLRERGKRS